MIPVNQTPCSRHTSPVSRLLAFAKPNDASKEGSCFKCFEEANEVVLKNTKVVHSFLEFIEKPKKKNEDVLIPSSNFVDNFSIKKNIIYFLKKPESKVSNVFNVEKDIDDILKTKALKDVKEFLSSISENEDITGKEFLRNYLKIGKDTSKSNFIEKMITALNHPSAQKEEKVEVDDGECDDGKWETRSATTATSGSAFEDLDPRALMYILGGPSNEHFENA